MKMIISVLKSKSRIKNEEEIMTASKNLKQNNGIGDNLGNGAV